jgi:protein TonB
MKYFYAKPAVISLFIHIGLFCLAALMADRVASYNPPPIELEIEPSRLIDMGSGKLHLTSGSPPAKPVKAVKPRTKMAAAKPAPVKPEILQPSQPAPPAASTKADIPSTRLPGETDATSVALPPPGEKQTAGGSSGYGAAAVGSKGKGAGSSTGEQDSSGGEYTDSGYRFGDLPGYPRAARRAGREGIVKVRVLLDTDGNPASVMVLETSGYEDFDTAAAQAVKKWRFSPARRGGKPVASFHDVRIRFRLYDTR